MAAPEGNSNRFKGKVFKSIIEERLEQRKLFEQIVDTAFAQAIEGDKDARNWIADRVDGKAVQAIEADLQVTTHEAALNDLK